MRFYLMLFLLVVSSTCLAQGPNSMVFTSLTTEDRLPSNRSTCTFKDHKGFVWIGCNEGLARYDGDEKFEVYTTENQPALKTDFITVINQDKDHNLWVGTKFGGITKYNYQEDRWTNYLSSDNPADNSLSNNEILSIMIDRNNKVWIGTENGLNIYSEETDSFTTYQVGYGEYSLKSTAILEIIEDANGYVWIGTWGSGFYLVLDSQGYDNLKFRQFLLGDKPPENVWCILQINENEYCIGTHQYGLVYLSLPAGATSSENNQDWEFSFKKSSVDLNRLDAITSNSVFDLVVRDQDLWIGTPSGLSILYDFANAISAWAKDKSGSRFLSYENIDFDPTNKTSLVNSDIKHLNVDDENLVWIATRGGVSCYNSQVNQFQNIKVAEEFYARPNTKNIVVIGDILWLTDGVSVLSYNTKTGKKNEFAHKLDAMLSGNSISCVSKNNNRELLLVVRDGVCAVNIQNWEHKHYKLPQAILQEYSTFIVKTIYVDDESRYWLATEKGVLILNTTTGEYRLITQSDENGLSDKSVTDIEEDNEGNIWVSTYSGLNKVVAESPTFKFDQYKFDPYDSLSIPSNRIIALENSNNYLLLGSEQGLILYDYATEKFHLNNAVENNFFIHSVHNVNDSIVWGSGTEGLFRYDLTNDKVKLFSSVDGIKDLTFSIGAISDDRSGRLYFGNISGAVAFDPNVYKENKKAPIIYVTKANVIGKDGATNMSLLNSGEVKLSHNDYYLRLSYVGLIYDKPSSTRFAHMLDGFDEDWLYTNSANDVTYTNLKPGTYTFRVKAKNSDGYWAELDNPIKVSVIPSFLQRLWVRLLLIGLFLLGLIAAISKYTRTVRRRNQQLEGLNSKLSEEVAQRTTIALELQKSEQKLKKTNFELVRSNKQLEEFAYIASHDLKEPLRTIGAFTELSKRMTKPDNVKQIEYMDIVKSAVGRMHSLIESILTFSSVDKGSLKLIRVDLQNIIGRNLLDLKEMITKKGTVVTVSDLPTIWADKSQLSMLFQNLISNGIKFNTSDHPFLKVYSLDDDDKQYYKIVVEDNGIGINKEYQKRIFELFKRLHSSSEFEGTGIGLAVCKQIVELHEGKLEVDSKEGIGTKFVISLPKYKESSPSI